jgi:hypothetical protein
MNKHENIKTEPAKSSDYDSSIDVYANIVATKFFYAMLDPKMRGSSFDFSTFKIEDLCQVFSLMLDPPYDEDEVARLKICVRKKWDSLVKGDQ